VSLVVAVIVALLKLLAPASYTVTATLLQSDPQPGFGTYGVVQSPPVSGSAYRSFIEDGSALEQALLRRGEATDPDRLEALVNNLRVEVNDEQRSGVIRLSLTGPDARHGAELVNDLARAVVIWDAERGRTSLTAGLADLEQAATALEEQHSQQTATGADPSATALELEQAQAELETARARLKDVTVSPLVSVLRHAGPVSTPDPKNPLPAALLAFVISALVGSGYVLLSRLTGRQLSSSEAGNLTGLSVLSTYPGGLNLGSRARAERDAADILRDNVLRSLHRAEGQALVILVTTAIGAGARRVVSKSLSDSFSRGGHRTLLLDANLRSHALKELFELSHEEGSRVERHESTPGVPGGLLDQRTMFDVVPSFSISDSPADLLRTQLPQLLGRWRSRFDVIILDSAPVLPYPDTRGI